MRSFLATWRVSLARTRADWPIVVAAWLITLLAAILFSAGLIYPSAASEAGLRRALADAPLGTTNVATSLYAPPAKALELDGQVQPELQTVLGGLPGSIVRDWRSAGTLALRGLPDSVDGDQAIVGYLDGLTDHATLVAGAWPAPVGLEPQPIQVVLAAAVAEQLGIHVGDDVQFVAHPSTSPIVVSAVLVGTFAPKDANDPFWDQDNQLLTGLHVNAQYRTFGPFLGPLEDILDRDGIDSIRFQWRLYADFAQLHVDDAPRLRGRVEVLEDRLAATTGVQVQVETGLPDILRDSERSLLVSRTSVLLVMAQLALLAGYAIILTATLLVDHRRIDTSMLRSRGAGPGQVALLALLEGLVLAVPAVLVAPWLAVGVLGLFNVVGPLAEVGLQIDPRVSTDAYVGAAAAGVVCVLLLVLPAALSARRFAAAQGDISRQETRTFGQRMGLDVAFLALTIIALWQLRLYGAPLTRTVQGSLGLDPLLVAAPAIGLVAGGVLALRILPLLAQAVESAVSRGRSLVVSLGSRQLARRPLRYTRAALLVMLAMSMGVFALSYAATWSSSQRDQAAYQAGADARVLVGDGPNEAPSWALPALFRGLPGVAQLSAVERLPKAMAFPLGGSVDVLALDADAAPSVVLARGDEGSAPLAALMAPLRDGRSASAFTELPDGTTYLRINPLIDINSISLFFFDPDTGEGQDRPLDPDTLEGVMVNATAIVRDAHGLLHDVATPVVPYAAGMELVLPLQQARAGEGGKGTGFLPPGARIDGPIELAAMGVEVWLPAETFTGNAVFGITALAAGTDAAGPWTDVPIAEAAAGDPWAAKLGQRRDLPTTVPSASVHDTTVELSGQGQTGSVFGSGTQAPAAVVKFLPSSVAGARDPVPVIANRALLDSLEAAQGDELTADLAGRIRRVVISGVVETFPTTAPAVPLMIIDESTLGLLRLGGTIGTRAPDEWWLSARDGDVDRLAQEVRAAPLGTAEITTVLDRTRTLSTDPVALGIIGALTLGFVATGLFAIVGLTVSTAVGARQRRTEFALLRALGLSGRQLASSLWLENGSLVVVSLVAGTTLGLVIGWLVLPFVTVTQQATTPVPPVIVHVPWDGILLLDLGSAVALGLAVIVIGSVLRRIGVGSILRMGED